MSAPALPLQGWLSRRGAWTRAGLGLLAGAAMTLAQPPVSVPWVLFAAVPALVWLLSATRTGWQALGLGWAAGFGYLVTGLHWIGHAFLVDPERFAWLMPFAVTLLPGGIALFWAAGFWLAHRLSGGRGGARGAVAFAVALTVAELARGHLLTGFPWALPAYAWVDTPVMQAGAWMGPYGFTLATLALAALPLATLRVPVAGAVALTVAGLWTGGTMRLEAAPPPDPEAPVVRVVQQNAPQALKWTEPHRSRFLDRLIAETEAPADPAVGAPEIVIWPETALPFLPGQSPQAVARIAAAAAPATLVTGTLFGEQRGEARVFTNSLMVLDPEGRLAARYDKHHLVPFGEYLPLHGLLSAIGLDAIAGMRGGGLVPGPGPRLVEAAGIPPFAPAICYEMIFPGQLVPPGPRPRWILTVTNDAWFGAFAGPHQHLAQARARAIEQGLPVVRAAQTGISAVIDAGGRVLETVALDTAGRIDARLPPRREVTPYSAMGDIPALIVLAGLAAALARRARRA